MSHGISGGRVVLRPSGGLFTGSTGPGSGVLVFPVKIKDSTVQRLVFPLGRYFEG